MRSLVLALVMLLPALVTGAALAQSGAPPSSQTLPPFDLLVYLDRSKTIFSGTGAGAPNERVAEMLRTVINRPIDDGRRTFVTAGDRLYLYTFGTNVQVIAEKVEGGNRDQLQEALGRFNASVVPDTKTDFSTLLASIAQNPVLSTQDNRLKLVLIASDFVDDPHDAGRRRDSRLGVCDLLEKPNRTRLEPDIAALQEVFAKAVNSSGGHPYMGLLSVEPKADDYPGLRLIASNPDNYLNCILQTVAAAPIQAMMESRLGAGRIRYDEVANDADAFAERFVTGVFRATLPRLMVQSGQCHPRRQQMECTLSLHNNARVANTVRKVRFFADDKATTPLFEVDSNSRIEPGQTMSLSVPVAAADAQRLPPARVSVGLEDEGTGAIGRTYVPISIPAPPTVAHVEATRAQVNDPLYLIAELHSVSGDTITPRAVLFYDSETGGAQIGEQNLPDPAVLHPATRQRIESPIPPSVQGPLLNGNSVFLAVRGEVTEMESSVLTARVPIPRPEFKPLAILSTQITPVDGSLTQFNLSLNVRNPDTIPKRPTNVLLLSGPDAGQPTATVQLSADVINPGASQNVQVRLPQGAVSLLSSGLFVTVTDNQSGQRSNVENAGAIPQSVPLTIAKADLRAVEGKDPFLLDVTVTNPGVVSNQLAAVVLYIGGGDQRQEHHRRLFPANAPVEVKFSDQITLSFPLTEEKDRSALNAGVLEVRALDRFQQYSPAYTVVQNNLHRPSLQIEKQDWTTKDGKSALKLTLFNPGDVAVTLTGIMVEQASNPRSRLPLPLINPETVPSRAVQGGMREVVVSYPDSLWSSLHPRDNVILSLECSNPSCASVRERLKPIPEAALAMAAEPNTWDTAVTPTVTITVRNPLAFSQPIREVRAALDENGSQAKILTRFEEQGRPEVPAQNAPFNLPVRFSTSPPPSPPDAVSDAEEYLTNSGQVFLCVVGLFDSNADQTPAKCPQPWLKVAIGARQPVKAEVRGTRPVNDGKITVTLVNNSGFPQKVSALAFDLQNGHPPLTEPLEKPETLAPNSAEVITHTLSPQLQDALRSAFTVRMAAVDLATADRPLTENLRNNGTTLVVNSFTTTIADVQRHEIYGSGGRMNIKADITVIRPEGGMVPSKKLAVWLTDQSGSVIPGSRNNDMVVSSLNSTTTFHPVWILPPGGPGPNAVSVHALVEDTQNDQSASGTIQDSQYKWLWDRLGWFLLSLAAILLILKFMFQRGYLRWAWIPFSQIKVVRSEQIDRYLSISSNLIGILAALGLTGQILSIFGENGYASNIAGNVYVIFFINIFISILMGLAIHYILTMRSKTIIATAINSSKNYTTYQEMISDADKKVSMRIYTLALVPAAIFVLLWFTVMIPYESQVNITKIQVTEKSL